MHMVQIFEETVDNGAIYYFANFRITCLVDEIVMIYNDIQILIVLYLGESF